MNLIYLIYYCTKTHYFRCLESFFPQASVYLFTVKQCFKGKNHKLHSSEQKRKFCSIDFTHYVTKTPTIVP